MASDIKWKTSPFTLNKSSSGEKSSTTKPKDYRALSNVSTKSGKMEDGAEHSQTQRKRNKCFENALLKWQEMGNDIIERKEPNFLPGREKTPKGARVKGKKTTTGSQLDEKSKMEEERIAKERYEEEIKRLAERITEDISDFKDMQKRSVRIEKDLKDLKQRSRDMLS